PANIDLSVTSIVSTFKVCGKPLSISSKDPSGNTLDELYFHYDTNGNPDKEYQEHNGAVNLSSSLYVGYGYGSASTGYRTSTLQYPTSGTNTSRVITDSYGASGSMNDQINQLDSIIDGTGTASSVTTGDTLDTITSLGSGTVVAETYNQPNLGYNLLDSTTLSDDSTPTPNLDQFNRVQ